MAGGYKHTPKDVEALAAEIRDLRRQLDALRSSVAARNTTISGGAGLTITDGGKFTVKDPDGDVIFVAGALPEYAPRPDGKTQVGWVLRRDSGEYAAYCLTNVTGNKQSWNWLDIAGNGVAADDAASGVGLARPYVPLPVGLARNADWPTTTSASFEVLWRGVVYRQHPRVQCDFGHFASTAGTTGQVRVMLGGVQVGSTVTASNSAVVQDFAIGSVTSVGSHCTEHELTIEARRTAGTGNIQVGFLGAWGIQT